MYDNVTKLLTITSEYIFQLWTINHLKKQEWEFFEFLVFITVKCDCIEFSKIHTIFEEDLYCTVIKYLLRITREKYHSL